MQLTVAELDEGGSSSASGGEQATLQPWEVVVAPLALTLFVGLVLLLWRRQQRQRGAGQPSEPWMWVTRGMYFADGFATAFWNPLAVTILVHDCGLSASSVGLVMALQQIASIPAASALAYVADRTRRHTLVYRLVILFPILVSVALLQEVRQPSP